MMFKKIIKEICDEEKISYKTISKDWIIVLEKNGVSNLIAGYKFGLNNHALGELLDDKFATYELLKDNGLPTIDYNILYAQSNKNGYAQGCNSIEYIEGLFNRYDKNVVLKVNDGTCGVNVLHISDIEVLKEEYRRLSNKYFSLSICPYYEIENEYRAIVVNEKAELVYKKIKPAVIGDGKSTIKELLVEFNEEYFSKIKDKSLNKIIPVGQTYEFDWKFNLARGARASLDFSGKVRQSVEKLAEEIAAKIGLKFGSIDIIRTKEGNFFVMEINSGVMMDNFINEIPDGYEMAKKIYKKAIKNFEWNVN